MALTYTNLVNSTGSTSNTNSYATSASYTPTRGSLVLAGVVASGTALASPTFSGNGLTWSLLGSRQGFNADADSVYLFGALGDVAPSNGAGTFNCTGDNATGAIIHVCQFNPVNMSAIADAYHQIKPGSGTAAPAITFDNALETHLENAVYCVMGRTANPFAATMETNWLEDYDSGYNTPATGLVAMHRIGTSDTSVAPTAPATATWGGIAIEVRELKIGSASVDGVGTMMSG